MICGAGGGNMGGKIIGLISCNYNNEVFGSLTAERGLAALPFGGRYRLLDFPLSNMVNAGIRTIGVITPYPYRAIMDHLGNGKEWSLNRKSGGMFILPGSVQGLKNMYSGFLLRDIILNRAYLDRSNEDYILLSGSHKLFKADLRPMIEKHIAEGRDITLLYKQIDDAKEHSGSFLKLADGKVSAISCDSPERACCFMDCFIINRGLLLKFIEWYKAMEHIDLLDIIAENLYSLNVGGFEHKGYLGQVDNIRDYMKCSLDLLSYDVRSELFGGEQKLYTKVQDSPPTRYGKEASVKNSLIPTGCIINGTVEDSVIFRGVRVGEGAVIKNCVIMQKTVIESGAELENVICDKYVTVAVGNKLCGTAARPLVIPKGSEV